MLRLQEGLNAGVARCAGWVAAQRDIAIPAPHQPSCPGAPPCPGPRGPPVPLVTCAVCPSGFPYEKVVQRVLYLQVLDYDRFSRNDPIGEVSIPLNKVDLTQMQTFWKDLKPCSDGSVRPQLQAPGGGLAARADRYRPSHPPVLGRSRVPCGVVQMGGFNGAEFPPALSALGPGTQGTGLCSGSG